MSSAKGGHRYHYAAHPGGGAACGRESAVAHHVITDEPLLAAGPWYAPRFCRPCLWHLRDSEPEIYAAVTRGDWAIDMPGDGIGKCRLK